MKCFKKLVSVFMVTAIACVAAPTMVSATDVSDKIIMYDDFGRFSGYSPTKQLVNNNGKISSASKDDYKWAMSLS